MTKPWHKTETTADTDAFTNDFWVGHSTDLLVGTFWADLIKKLQNEPAERLALAVKNLPLPGAFKEAALAIRALIRDKRKSKESYEDELSLLYWLAATNSFPIPYSELLRLPGYCVTESIPGSVMKTLSFSYKSLGYNKLTLLNKTDVKWLVEQWGNPSKHTTLHAIHIDVWRKYERILKDNEVSIKDSIAAAIRSLG